MKTYALNTFFILCMLGSLVYGQTSDVEFSVIKEYDKDGNLIRYDSTRVKHFQHSKNSFQYSFSTKDMDSLLQGIGHIGDKMSVFIPDSILTKLDHMFDDKGIKIWMDDDFVFGNTTKDFFFDFENEDKFKYCLRNFDHDSLMKVQLEKELEEVEKRLKKKRKEKKSK